MLSALFLATAHASAPAGWASDADYAGTIAVHVYGYDPDDRPRHYTQYGSGAASMNFEQTATPGDRTLTHASLPAQPGEGAYLTAMDAVVNGVSVWDVIFDFASAAGCSAEIECNGVDEDCTGEDRCGTSGGGDSGAEPHDSGTVPGDDTGADAETPGDARGASRSPGPTGCAGALPVFGMLSALQRRGRR